MVAWDLVLFDRVHEFLAVGEDGQATALDLYLLILAKHLCLVATLARLDLLLRLLTYRGFITGLLRSWDW